MSVVYYTNLCIYISILYIKLTFTFLPQFLTKLILVSFEITLLNFKSELSQLNVHFKYDLQSGFNSIKINHLEYSQYDSL